MSADESAAAGLPPAGEDPTQAAHSRLLLDVTDLTGRLETSLRTKFATMQSEVISEVAHERRALLELLSALSAPPLAAGAKEEAQDSGLGDSFSDVADDFGALAVAAAPVGRASCRGAAGAAETDPWASHRDEPAEKEEISEQSFALSWLPPPCTAAEAPGPVPSSSKWRRRPLAHVVVDDLPAIAVTSTLLDGVPEAVTAAAGSDSPSKPVMEAHTEHEEVASPGDTMDWEEGSEKHMKLASRSKSSVMSSVMSSMSSGSDGPSWMRKVVTSWEFEILTSTFILVNCATMGMQAHQEVTGELGPQWLLFLEISEHVFTVFFLIECLLRLKVYGWRGFTPTKAEGRSNLLDAFLVFFTGVIITWAIPLWAFLNGSSSESGFLRMLTVFRAIRLARLVRVLRKIPIFREAWMLIRGLGDSARTLFWTVTVIFFVTYGFAIFGIKMIVQPLQGLQSGMTDPEDVQRIAALMPILSGMDKLMFTLVQVLTEDSFHAFMREIVHYLPWAWAYFYCYIAIACLVLMNLVTAIIVENAMETSRNDHEQQLQDKISKQAKEVRELKKLFEMMDADGSGTLCWDEFRQSFKDADMQKKWRLLDFQPDDCKELFKLLDDGDGEIETNEFFEGLTRMKGLAQAKDVFRLQKCLDKFQLRVDALGRDTNNSEVGFARNMS